MLVLNSKNLGWQALRDSGYSFDVFSMLIVLWWAQGLYLAIVTSAKSAINYKDETMRKTDTLQDNKEIINELKQKDSHFAVIFDEHTQLDEQINRLEKDRVKQASCDDEIEQMKRRKLQLKDEIYRIIDKNKV